MPRTTLLARRHVMAVGFFKRAMVYLGLVDDDFGDYEDYEPRVGGRAGARLIGDDEEPSAPSPVAVASSTIRPLPRDDSGQPATLTTRTTVRTVSAESDARVHVVAPIAIRRRPANRRSAHGEPTCHRQLAGGRS